MLGVDSGPCHESEMVLFAIIVSTFQLLITLAESSILDGRNGSEYTSILGSL